MSLVETTSPVPVAQLTEQAARDLIDSMKQSYGILERQVVRAFQGRAWLPLGYTTWNEMCEAEFSDGRIRLPRESRQELHAALSAEGMSTRAIAAVTGVSYDTVQKDLAGDRNLSPAPSPVTGDADDREASEVGEHVVVPDIATSPVTDNSAALDAVFASFTNPIDDEIVDAEIVETPRVTGVDGKSYPKPAPKPQPTREEQRAIDLAESDARTARYVQKAISNWPALYGLRTNPRRELVLAHLCESDLAYLADIEGKLQ